MGLTHPRLFNLFKYAVYLLLIVNIFLFLDEEWTAAPHRFVDGVSLGNIIEGFAATIDTTAWVILLLMFELETYVLADDQFTRRVTLLMHGARALCYGFIVYAFYGYLTKLLFLFGITPAVEIANLCALAGDQWAYAVDLDEYELITAGNCAGFSSAAEFYRFPGMSAVVDAAGRTDIVRLAWVDVINAGVWLGVVLLLEIDVRLQERGLLGGLALRLSNAGKYLMYTVLFLAAVYWGWKGDFVDFWDAFLWLVAFVFIEMNVLEWRQEALAGTPASDHRGVC
jgi:hypothetical protein